MHKLLQEEMKQNFLQMDAMMMTSQTLQTEFLKGVFTKTCLYWVRYTLFIKRAVTLEFYGKAQIIQ